ncbi:efflux RND transporter periplasmic adaptor subunit [uncultured Pseudoteredinibacter sp.]|uniref:efflux RND transporter periplasmic adaptor subunit n=1 Tax=uncultured Pseudoteredinibacter sp. TaxID=1641701 RepID=UPI00260D354E|nr:efflux RND transporter periplasmic adaptor subunit [uncultured Pseudoteredinibacter sp.]
MSLLSFKSKAVAKSLLALCLSLPITLMANDVELVYPQADDFGDVLPISASVEALQHSKLATQQAGLLSELYVEVGDSVQAGDILLKLDDQLAKLEVNQAQASLKAAQVAKDEAERLHKELKALASKKFVAATQISERRAQLAQSQAELSKQKAALAIKQEELRRHSLRAPFNGVIAQRQTNIGEWVNQQSTVMSLVQQDALRLRLAIPQEYFTQVTLGAPVEIHSDHGKVSVFSASIDRVVPISNQKSRTFEAFVTIPASAGLTVGMSATVNIALIEQENLRLWFPKSAIKQHPDGGASVFAVQNNRAKRYIVKIIEREGDRIAVNGAPASMAYVRSGVELLQDGDSLDSKLSATSKEPQQ